VVSDKILQFRFIVPFRIYYAFGRDLAAFLLPADLFPSMVQTNEMSLLARNDLCMQSLSQAFAVLSGTDREASRIRDIIKKKDYTKDTR